MENVFYKQAIAKFPLSEFEKAGYPLKIYDNLKYIVHDEEEHVKLLTAALTAAGAKPVAACEYKFSFTDVKSFLTLSSVLEGVGTAAYTGGAGYITSPEYLGVAASILVTEALHTSIQRVAVDRIGAANPYGTSLGLNAVFTLAAAFIKSCPATNVALPVKAFPSLSVAQGQPAAPSIDITFIVDGPGPKDAKYLVFVNGLDTIYVPITEAVGSLFTAKIPATASGQTYVFLTKGENTGPVTDDIVLNGPAIVEVTPGSPTFDPSLQ